MDAQTFKPTDEQVAITDFIRDSSDNLIINALAGTGKTSTLGLIEKASPTRNILCLAFNKKIAKEMQTRFPPDVTVSTLNSLGHRVWGTVGSGKVVLDTDENGKDVKIINITRQLIKDEYSGQDAKEAWENLWDVVSAVGMAKALGYVPDGKYPNARRLISREAFHDSLETKPSPLTAELIDLALFYSIKVAYAGSIDFNDQIYMPALFGGTFPRFPYVMVDEFQDLNPVNHAMLEKLGRDRLTGVGDPWQSIYAFRGAVRDGMAKAKIKFKMSEKTISISFRCPSEIVKNVHWRVPHFKWFKEGGHVEKLEKLDLQSIKDTDAIICRNNAPLFRLALNLLAERRSVSVAGSDLGPRIVGIMRKLGPEETKQEAVADLIEDWLGRKLKNSQAVETLHDMANCMRIFNSWGANLGQAMAYANRLFKERGSIQLMTGHKSKGLEFDRVFHLDPFLIRDSDQDLNLRYVISTRARQELYEINSEGIH